MSASVFLSDMNATTTTKDTLSQRGDWMHKQMMECRDCRFENQETEFLKT